MPAQDCIVRLACFQKRHYSGADMSAFAMALFLGKPAILVEHHEFFRKGPGGSEHFAERLKHLRPDPAAVEGSVRRLRDLSPALQWSSLVETITRTHARRKVSDGNL